MQTIKPCSNLLSYTQPCILGKKQKNYIKARTCLRKRILELIYGWLGALFVAAAIFLLTFIQKHVIRLPSLIPWKIIFHDFQGPNYTRSFRTTYAWTNRAEFSNCSYRLLTFSYLLLNKHCLDIKFELLTHSSDRYIRVIIKKY